MGKPSVHQKLAAHPAPGQNFFKGHSKDHTSILYNFIIILPYVEFFDPQDPFLVLELSLWMLKKLRMDKMFYDDNYEFLDHSKKKRL